MREGGGGRPWSALVPFFGANVLFGSGLFAHALLYNFYLQGLGFGEGAMGIAAASLTAGGLAALAPAGVAVDRWGARPVYLGAVLLAALGLTLGAWAERSVVVFAAAGVAGFGTASWRVAMGPVLMQVAGPSVRSRAFSWNVALLLASGAVWTALAGSLSAWTAQEASPVGGIRTALWLGAAGTALAGAAFLLLPRGSVATPSRAAPSPKWPTLSVPRDVALLVAAVFVWMLGAALVLPFFNLYFQRVHGLSVERIGMIFAAAQALTALVVFLGGELAQRWGPRRTFGVWAAIFPLALLAMVLGPGTWAAVLLFTLQGLPSPATNPLLDEIVLDTAPSDRRGAASSWRNGATEASGLVGAALGGLLLERLGFGPLLSVAAVVAAAGAWALSRSFARSAR
ncbi:MAG: MFS transporter [Longimicrobiales bacterium]|nr:MFS transporter [Longimicrobiales bacterium]